MPTVAVTTTPDAAPRLVVPLLRHGLEPVRLPCLAVHPSDPADLEALRDAAAGADWIVATSPRAVEITWPEGGMPPVPVAAVGPRTAGAATAAGGTVAVVGDRDAGSLVDSIAGRLPGRKVVFPHGRSADPATAAALARAGARVTAVVAYDTVPVPPGPRAVDAAIFGSPSAVAGWCTARTLTDLTIAVLGATTAAAVRERGGHPDVMPARPGFGGVAEALAGHLHERSAP
jgi:uroporphyrinogen-III synthase